MTPTRILIGQWFRKLGDPDKLVDGEFEVVAPPAKGRYVVNSCTDSIDRGQDHELQVTDDQVMVYAPVDLVWKSFKRYSTCYNVKEIRSHQSMDVSFAFSIEKVFLDDYKRNLGKKRWYG